MAKKKSRPSLPPHPSVPRAIESTVEQRLRGALEQFTLGRYSLAEAARVWKVPYAQLYNRRKGAHPVSKNGGNHTRLDQTEEAALFTWIHRQVALGIHVRAHSLF